MSRKTLYICVTCLLYLLPALSFAQSLTLYEYWFDDDFDNRISSSLSGANAVVNTSIDANQLDNGIHKFSFRAKQSDGKFSAVSSSLFLKRPAAQGSQVEYWFDDNFDQRDKIDILNTEDEQELSLDLRSSTKYPMGFHKLNMRVTLEGEGESAIYSSDVVKLSAGKATRLEYWIDDDIAHSQTIEGKPSTDGSLYQFLTDLDFSGVSPGYHRLNCRSVSTSKRTSGAVTTMPIMVKSRYNASDTELVTVTDQLYWFDTEEPKELPAVKPSNEIYQPYNLDVRKLSEGQHTLHFQFGNSAGIWNGPVDFSFKKTKTGSYQVVADATVENGIVTIKYSTVPFGHRYAVFRQYPSGTKRKINDIKTTNYPADLQAIDTPAPGTYTYYVEGIYTDADGVEQRVRSGEVEVTVENKASTVPYGRIFGLLTIDGQRYSGSELTDYVLINGENVLSSSFGYRSDNQGKFCIEYIPYGSEITIGINKDNYVFEEKKIIMDEKTDDQHIKFNGVKIDDIVEQPSNDSYDLELASVIYLTPNAWELKVRNNSEEPWSGDLIVKVISKKAKDKYDNNKNPDDQSFWSKISNLFSSKGSEEDEILFTATTKTHIWVEGKKYSAPLSLDIIDMPEKNKKEDYYVYVYSLKEGTDNEKELSGRYYGNPQVLEFNPFDIGFANKEEFVDYVHCYQEFLKHFKELAKWGDPFEKELKDMSDYTFDMWIESLDKANKEEDPDLMEDIIKGSEKVTGFLLNSFCSDLRKEMKKVKSSSLYKTMTNLDDLYRTIKGFHDANQLDEKRKIFATASQVLKIYKKLKIEDYYGNPVPDPIINLYATYFDVGESLAEAAGRIANHYSKLFVWQRLSEGNGIYKIKIRKFRNDDSVEYFRGEDFYPKPGYTWYNPPHNGQIESISIELVNHERQDCKLPCTDYEVDWDDDANAITIKNVVFNKGNNNTNYYDVEAWMIITWKNKRVTRVPLLEENFVKLENLNEDVSVPLIMTVEFQSDTYMNLEKIPNRLSFVKPKSNWPW